MTTPRVKQSGEWTWVLLVSLGIVFLASIPYLLGYAVTPPGHKFLGLTYNVDDALVYMSWMRQAADGHFFIRNLFTSEPQSGHGFNLLLYTLGRLAGVTHLPLIAVFHMARVVFGVGLLLLIYAFARLWTADMRTRRLALVTAGLASGIGFLWPMVDSLNKPVDMWQPEAVTFLSVYLSPLFSFSMMLMLGSLYLLHRHAATGRVRHAVLAGALLLLLGNVHSYDVIPLALTWAAYAVVSLLGRPRNSRPMIGGIVAVVIGAPSVAYQAYLYSQETVFRLRADVPTLSPPVVFYLCGFGLLIPLAALGISRLRSEKADYRLLACWVGAAFVAAYLPLSFQRKLIMGVHIPLSILAASGIVFVTSRVKGRTSSLAGAAIILLLIPSNVLFAARDVNRIVADQAHTTAHAPFISVQELQALDYIRRNARPDDVVLAQPYFASLVPAYTGRRVYCGHWGETARFEEKFRGTWEFFSEPQDVEHRSAFVRKTGVRYVVDYRQLPDAMRQVLLPVFEAEDIVVYRTR